MSSTTFRGRAVDRALQLLCLLLIAPAWAQELPPPDDLEPNGEASAATPVEIGKPIQATISPVADQDWFRIEVPERGLLNIVLDPLPPDLTPVLVLHDADGKELTRVLGAYPRRLELLYEAAGPQALLLLVLDGAWGPGEHGWGGEWNNQASVHPYTLSSSFVPAKDATEPNDEREKAPPLPMDATATGTIFPRGDADFFTVEVPERARGVLVAELIVPDPVAPFLELLDEAGNRLASRQAGAGGRVTLRVPVASSAKYTLCLRDGLAGRGEHGWGGDWGNASSVEPWRLSLSLLDAADANEPNESLDQTAPLAWGKEVSGTLFPRGDVDAFRIEVPAGAARLVVSWTDLPAHVSPFLQILDPDRQEYRRIEVRPGMPVLLDEPIHRPGTWFVQLQDGAQGWGEQHGWGHEWRNQQSERPYRLRADLLPVRDPSEPNDSVEAARDLPFDAPAEATLWPPGDHDYFRVRVPEPGYGRLRIEVTDVPEAVAPFLRLYAADGSELSTRGGADGLDLTLEYGLRAAGDFVVLLQDGAHGRGEQHGWGHEWNNAGSPAPYRIEARFESDMDASEPNEEAGKATPLQPSPDGTPAGQGAIWPWGDVDFFSVDLEAGKWECEGIGFDPCLSPCLIVQGPTGGQIARCESPPVPSDRGVIARFEAPEKGRYLIVVRDCGQGRGEGHGWGHEWGNRASMAMYRLVVRPSTDPAVAPPVEPAPAEPPASAKPEGAIALDVSTGEAEAACPLPAPSVEAWFRIEVTRPGRLRASLVQVPGWIDAKMELRDEKAEKVLVAADGFALQATGGEERLFADVRPGRYLLRVFDAEPALAGPGGTARIAVRFTPVVSMTPADAPPDITADGHAEETTFPAGDEDTFAFVVGKSGTLTVALDNVDLALRPEISVVREDSNTLRALYVNGGRSDYNLPDRMWANVEWTRATADGLCPPGRRHHLGDEKLADWPDCEGERRSFPFSLDAPPRRAVLSVRVLDHHLPLVVRVNGQEAARFVPGSPTEIELPAGLLRQGENAVEFEVSADGANRDDLLLQDLRLEGEDAQGGPLAMDLEPFLPSLRAKDLARFDVVVLDGLTSIEAFDLDRTETQAEVLSYVEQGGRFVLLCPQAPSGFGEACRRRGGELISAPTSYDDGGLNARNMIDGGYGRSWASATKAPFPHEFVLAFPRRAARVVDTVVLWAAACEPARRPREVEVSVSDEAPDAGFRSVGRFSVETTALRQEFKFAPAAARFVKVSILSNQGHSEHTEMGEIEVHGPGTARGYFGLWHVPGWSDEQVVVLDREDPVAGQFAQGPWNGYAASDQNSSFEVPSGSEFHIVAAPASDERRAITAVRRIGKGLLVLDTQEVGYPGNTVADWRIPNLLGHPNFCVLRARGSLVPSGGNPRGRMERFEVPVRDPGRLLIRVHDPEGGWSPRPWRLSVTAREPSDPGEPDDRPEQARRMEPGRAARGTIEPAGDRDFFRVPVFQPSRLRLWVRGPGEALDPVVTLYRADDMARPLVVLDGSLGDGRGFAEWGVLEVPAGVLLVEVRDRDETVRCADPYELTAEVEPLSGERPFAACDELGRAAAARPGEQLAVSPDPPGARTVLEVSPEQGAEVDVRLLDVPQTADPVVEVLTAEGRLLTPLRVLHLACRADFQFEDLFPHSARWTRIEAGSPEARRAADRLGEFDVVILDAPRTLSDFGAGEQGFQEKVLKYAEAGGRFVILSPEFSLSEIAAGRGGRLVRQTSQWDDRWGAAKLIDGLACPGNAGPTGWCCASGQTTNQELVFELGGEGERLLDRVVIYNHAQGEDERAKDVELSLGLSADGPFDDVAKAELEQRDGPQELRFAARKARFVRLLVVSNRGNASETQIGEVEAYGPESPTFLGMSFRQVYNWTKAEAPDPSNALAGGVVPATPERLDRVAASVALLGFREAGFAPVLLVAGETDAAISVSKPVGKGLLIVESIQVGYPPHRGPCLWRLANLLGRDDPLVAKFDVTCGARGSSEAFSFVADRPGPYFLIIREAQPAGGLGAMRFSASYREAKDRWSAPAFASVCPPDGAAAIDPASPLRVSLTRPADPASVAEARFEVVSSTGQAPTLSATYDAAARAVVLAASRPFAAGATVSVRHAGGLRDDMGREFPAELTWSFQVAAEARVDRVTVTVEASSAVVGPRPVRIRVRASGPLDGPPEVSLAPVAGGARVPVRLTETAAGEWAGEATAPPGAGEGPAMLAVVARSADGQPVQDVRATAVRIDLTPPSPPRSPLLVAGPRGRVDASFPAAAPGEGTVRMLLLREAPGGQLAEAAVLAGPGPGTLSDRSSGGGRVVYRLAAEDEAGNRSRPSEPAAIEVAPPSLSKPVQGVAAVPRGGSVVVTWNPSDEAGVDGYSVYRRADATSFEPLDVPATAHLEPGRVTCSDRPRDGRYVYFVVARARSGDTSPLSDPVEVLLDTAAPYAEIKAQPWRRTPGLVELDLRVNEDLAQPPSLQLALVGRDPLVVTLEAAGERTFRGRVEVPADAPDGEARFGFLGIDPSGNRGEWISSGATVYVDQDPPTADVYLDPPPPLRAGVPVRLVLILHEETDGPPQLSIVARGVEPAIALTPTNDPRRFESTVTLPEGVADGVARFTLRARDAFGHEGGRIVRQVEAAIGDGPVRSLYESADPPTGDLQWEEGTRPLRLALALSKSCSSVHLVLKTSDGAEHEVAMEGSGDRWRGSLSIADSAPDGPASFHLTAVDLTGQTGTRFTRGEMIMLSRRPPGAPVAVRARAVAAGQVEVSWEPPAASGALPVPVAGYCVRRKSSDGGAEVVVAERVKALQVTDPTPADGDWSYAVSVVSVSGVEGPAAPAVVARSDREPPARPARPSVAPSDRGTAVRVEFAPVPEAVGYRLLRGTDGSELVASGEAADSPFVDPSPGGRLRYAVVALDAAGNQSPPSEETEIDFESSLPVATVGFDPPSPLTGKGGTVSLATSHPLSGPPTLALVGSDGSEVALELTGEGAAWTGKLPALDALPAGKARVRFLGTARVDGAEVESQLVKGMTEVVVDARPATFRLLFPEGTPKKGDRWMVKAGTYRLSLVADEPLDGPPRLRFFPSGSTEGVPLELTAAGGGYECALTVDANTGDGAGLFEVESTDVAGNAGGFLAEGKVAFVRTATPPVLPAVRIATLTRGRVFVAWNPPDDPAVRRFEVFRATGAGDRPDADPEKPVFVVDRALGVEDRPGAGRFLYSVRGVDDAGNPGPLSAWAAAESDLSPPAPPKETKGEALKNGTIRLAWEPPDGEAPAFYNVYFGEGDVRDPAKARRMNEMYPFTEIYGAPPEDGTFTFFVTAVDAKLNESPPSPGVLLSVTDHPPIATVRVSDAEGKRVNRMRATSYDIEVSADQALDGPPELGATFQDAASEVPIELVAEGAVYRGRLQVPEDAPEGAAYFAFRGRDEQGNEGREILEGEYFEVDRTPPLAAREPAAAVDSTDRLGAIDVTWKAPEGETPHFYRVYRRAAEGTETLVTTLRVRKVDETYSWKDVPPSDGRYAYRIQPVDLAGNAGPISDPVEAESKTQAPKAAIEVRAAFSAGRPISAMGLGVAEVVLVASAPLSEAPSLSLEVEGKATSIALAAAGDDGRTFSGRLEATAETPEGDGLFRFAGVDREGREGSFISSGAMLTIDRTPAEADVTIEDMFELRPNRYTCKLERIPVRAGDRRVRLAASKPLAAAPELLAAPEGSEAWIPVPLAGDVPGTGFAGVLSLPAAGPEGPWRFRFRGADLMGNGSDRIAKPKRSFRLEEVMDPTAAPRILQTFETTGETFVVDVAPPEAPEMLTVEHLKLGVFAFTYKPREEPPITYNLYRSLVPILSTAGLDPVRREIRAETIVDAPPADGRYFWVVTSLDAAGNESAPSNHLSAIVDSIKPELKIKPVPTEDFVVIDVESDQAVVTLYMQFPGGQKRAVLGGDTGELEVVRDVDTGVYHHRLKLKPQQLEVFNGKVEIIVHSPDPAGNVVEQTAEISVQPLDTATGAVVESVDQGAALIIPPGAKPVIPSQPKRQVRDRGNLVFLRYERIPRDPRAPKESPKDPDPLPLELEMVSKPYRVEINQDVEEPMELRASASQAKMPELPKIVFSVSELADFGDQYTDPEFMKNRIKVVRWSPPEPGSKKKGRWETVPEIEIDLANWKVIAPAEKITSYVVVAETTPPSIREMEPSPDAIVGSLRPVISARIVDKGTGVAVGPENRISLKLDGEVLEATIDDADPTEVTVRFAPKGDLAPGGHVVTLYAEDVVENRRTASWRFTIHTDPPEILEVYPEEGRPTAAERPLIAAHALDTGGGIDGQRSWIRLDGSPLAARCDAAGGLVLAVPDSPIEPGPHRVELGVSDRCGVTAVVEWTFVADRAGPQVTALAPAADGAVREAEVLTAQLLDREAGLDADSVSLVLDGREVGRGAAGLPGYEYRADAGALSYRPAQPIAEGAHEALIQVRDRLGNATRFPWRFTVDRSPPELLALVDWRPDLSYPLLAVRVVDRGCGAIEGPPEVHAGRSAVPPERIQDGEAGRYFVRPSAEGAVMVLARDRAGNEAKASFAAAPSAPEIEAAMTEAEALRAAGKLAEAEKGLRALLAARPHESRASNLLAIVVHALGRRDEAVAILVRLVEADPLARIPRYNLALAHEAAGRRREAIEQFRTYLRIDSEGEFADKARARLERLTAGDLRSPNE